MAGAGRAALIATAAEAMVEEVLRINRREHGDMRFRRAFGPPTPPLFDPDRESSLEGKEDGNSFLRAAKSSAITWCVAQANHVQGVEILAYVTSHLSAVCKGSFFEVAISSQNATPKVHTAIEEPFCNVTSIVGVVFVSLIAFASASESVDVALTS